MKRIKLLKPMTNTSKVLTPPMVVKALVGIRPNTDGWLRKVTELRTRIDDIEKDPGTWLSGWWACSCARLQLDVCCMQAEKERAGTA